MVTHQEIKPHPTLSTPNDTMRHHPPRNAPNDGAWIRFGTKSYPIRKREVSAVPFANGIQMAEMIDFNSGRACASRYKTWHIVQVH